MTTLAKLCSYDDSESEEHDDEEEEEERTTTTSLPNGEVERKHTTLELVENREGSKHALPPSSAMEGSDAKKMKMSSSSSSSRSKARLPLPAAFLSTPSTTTTSFDDGHLSHQRSDDGRVRAFAHVRGNWASHVFLPFVDDELEELGEKMARAATETLKVVRDAIKTSSATTATTTSVTPEVRFISAEDLHLSLSRTFVLGHHLIPSFVDSLAKSVEAAAANLAAAPGSGFLLALSSKVKIYFNDEKTRGFIAVEVDPSTTEPLRLLTSAVDSTLVDFNLGDHIFYADPSFHLSLAWFLPPAIVAGGDDSNGDAASEAPSIATASPSFPSLPLSSSSLSSNVLSSVAAVDSSTSSHPRNRHNPSPPSHSPDPLPRSLISSLESSLSSLVADHFRENSSSSSAAAATVVKRVLFKTGNKLHSFPL